MNKDVRLLLHKTTFKDLLEENTYIHKITVVCKDKIDVMSLYKMNQECVLIYICPTIVQDSKINSLIDCDTDVTLENYTDKDINVNDYILAISTTSLMEYEALSLKYDNVVYMEWEFGESITKILNPSSKHKFKYTQKHPGYVGSRAQTFVAICGEYTDFLYDEIFKAMKILEKKKLKWVELKNITFNKKIDGIPLHVLQYGNIDPQYNNFKKRTDYFECDYPFRHVQKNIFDLYGYYLVDESLDNKKFDIVLYYDRPKSWDKRRTNGLWHHMDYFDDKVSPQEESDDDVEIII
jgi:hypothetical protein